MTLLSVAVVVLLGLSLIVMIGWDMRADLFDVKRSAPVIPARKQRLAEYVRGERQLMADWEEAFGLKPPVAMSHTDGVLWLGDYCQQSADWAVDRALIIRYGHGGWFARCMDKVA